MNRVTGANAGPRSSPRPRTRTSSAVLRSDPSRTRACPVFCPSARVRSISFFSSPGAVPVTRNRWATPERWSIAAKMPFLPVRLESKRRGLSKRREVVALEQVLESGPRDRERSSASSESRPLRSSQRIGPDRARPGIRRNDRPEFRDEVRPASSACAHEDSPRERPADSFPSDTSTRPPWRSREEVRRARRPARERSSCRETARGSGIPARRSPRRPRSERRRCRASRPAERRGRPEAGDGASARASRFPKSSLTSRRMLFPRATAVMVRGRPLPSRSAFSDAPLGGTANRIAAAAASSISDRRPMGKGAAAGETRGPSISTRFS